MNTLTLHPINHGFNNDNGCPMETWEVFPEHVASLFRSEYKFLRQEGTSRRAARWHVHRMLTMLWPSDWHAEPVVNEEDHVHDSYCDRWGHIPGLSRDALYDDGEDPDYDDDVDDYYPTD